MTSDADALARLAFLVQGELAALTKAYDLSPVQTRLLGILRDREPTMNELGRHLGLDKSSTSGLVDRAERRGLVTRTADPRDRRAIRVAITAEGARLAADVTRRFDARVDELLEPLPASDRRRLAHLADRVTTAADELRSAGVRGG